MLQVNPLHYPRFREAHKSGSGGGGSFICCCWSNSKRPLQCHKTRRNCSTASTVGSSVDSEAVEMQVALLRATACLQPQGHHGWGTTEQKGLKQQTREETRSATLEAELLQLLRRSRLQLEHLQYKHDTGADSTLRAKNHRSGRDGGILSYGECSIKSAASWARLLQNVRTLSMLQQQLQQEMKRQQQQQREASAPAAAAAAIEAFIQEMQQRCDVSNKCDSTKEALMMLLPKKRVYWQQQQQQRQLLLQLVDQVLADLELWAGEAPSDDEAAASPIPVQAAVAVHLGGRQQSTEERRRDLPLEAGAKREVLLQPSFKSMGAGVGAGTARAATPPACLDDTHVGEHLLDTASEMKQGALMFRERLQRDNILLQRTAATQEALQQQQRRGLDAARKLLRFSFFSSLMPLVQLAFALAVTVAMVSFILITPG